MFFAKCASSATLYQNTVLNVEMLSKHCHIYCQNTVMFSVKIQIDGNNQKEDFTSVLF